MKLSYILYLHNVIKMIKIVYKKVLNDDLNEVTITKNSVTYDFKN